MREVRNEGQVVAAREHLLMLLQFHNPAALPREVLDRIAAASDPHELYRWFDLALAADLAALRAAIGA